MPQETEKYSTFEKSESKTTGAAPKRDVKVAKSDELEMSAAKMCSG